MIRPGTSIVHILTDPDEGRFLQALFAPADNRDTLLKYADYLHGRDEMRVEFLRLEHLLSGAGPIDEFGLDRPARYRELLALLAPFAGWLRIVKRNDRILNCGRASVGPLAVRFRYQCPNQWETLSPTPEAGARYCGECRQRVYFCDSVESVEQHPRKGDCIAVPQRVTASVGDELTRITGETATRLPGVTFGGTFPRLARLAHRMAVVRSFSHETSDHTLAVQQVMRGGNSGAAGMGAIVARLRGASHSASGMPTNIYLNETELDPQFDKERQRLLEAAGPGQLGGGYAPFPLGFTSPLRRDLELCVSRRRLEDRRAMRNAFDQIARAIDTEGTLATMDRYEQQAFDLLVGRSRGAFDLSSEDPRLVERYDTRRFQTGLKEYR